MIQPPRETPAPHLDADGLPPLFDTGNTMLARVQCNLVVGKIPTPDGERGVATIRTQTTTLTVILDKAEAMRWQDTLRELAESLSGTALVLPDRGQAQRIASAARDQGNGRRT
jgi:hypothetical protein